VLLIQAAAAVLLLLGSALIFRALFEIDAPSHSRPTVRPFRRPQAEEPEIRLPRAA
jgi:hypothetical protein